MLIQINGPVPMWPALFVAPAREPTGDDARSSRLAWGRLKSGISVPLETDLPKSRAEALAASIAASKSGLLGQR